MYRRVFNSKVESIRLYSTRTSKVWVMTDGGLESTLQALTLGKQLSSNVTLRNVVASKKLQVFPAIIQKYLVNFKKNKNDQSLPWYLTDKQESHQDNSMPDYIITSGQDAIPASIHYADLFKKAFSVYLGYPNMPFINFDQVVLPKYLANAKMAALGPLARQKNGIITPTPLLDPSLPVKASASDGYTSVIIGGHSPECRWYSEDGVNLADTVKRMVTHLNDRVNVVFTERTPDIVKDKFTKRIETLPDPSIVTIWDSTRVENIQEKIDKYQEIIQDSKRVVVTADLDYASAHAVANSKPVYIAFGGHGRSYLAHFHRFLSDHHLTRKLRLDRVKKSNSQDPYSYLGTHPAWGDAKKALQIKNTMQFVTHEIEAIRDEKVTGKRRKN